MEIIHSSFRSFAMRWCRLSSRCFPSAIMVNDRLAAVAVIRCSPSNARYWSDCCHLLKAKLCELLAVHTDLPCKFDRLSRLRLMSRVSTMKADTVSLSCVFQFLYARRRLHEPWHRAIRWGISSCSVRFGILINLVPPCNPQFMDIGGLVDYLMR